MMDAVSQELEDARPVPSGIAGLDEILAGGFSRGSVHLVEGAPGTGKTALGLQFLLDGRERGERGLYVTLSETKRELMRSARTHGWSLDGIDIFELVPPELTLDPEQEQTLVYASDLELGETVAMVRKEVERVKPNRVIFDSVSEIRLLSQGSLRYRRQVLALKNFLSLQNCTTLFLDDLTQQAEETSLHSMVHGVVRLHQTALQFGGDRRRLQISKLRGREYKGGFHDFVIRKGGLRVFPRLIAAEHDKDAAATPPVTTGIVELDALLGGGLSRGTSTLIMGPSGTGKSHFLEALGHHAIEQGLKGTWTTLEGLGQLVRRHRVDDSVAKAIGRLLRTDLIVVDGIGLLPAGADAAEAFYRLIDAAYETRSLAVSSNVHPASFDELMPATLAAAGVERLLHHAHVILTDGDSYRQAEAIAGKGVTPLTTP